MNDQDVLKSLEEARKGPKRNFTQSVDLVINLKNVDFKNPANRINLNIMLPAGRGREAKIGVFGDTDFLSKAKNADTKIGDKQLAKTPKEIRKVAEQVDFFIAQTTLMVEIGKGWGKFLSTRGKMPQSMPPAADPTPMIMKLKNTTSLKSRGNAPQSVSCTVGIESMKDEELVKNVMAVYNALLEKLPLKSDNIKAFLIKTTMGPSVKIAI